MTTQEALCLLEASRNDPVLAAWAAVFYEHRVLACYDASPYDAWDAYQELFMLGVVSPSDFDNTDVKQVFFSGRRPTRDQIQSALDNLDNLPSSHEGSISMTKLGNPFGKNTGLTPSTRNDSQLQGRPNAIPLGGQSHLSGPPILSNPPAMRQEMSPMAPMTQVAMNPMASPSLAPMGQGFEANRPDISTSQLEDIKPTMYCCCGTQLTLINEGGQGLEDDMPQGNVRIIDAVFYAKCPSPQCNKVWHCSVGEPVPHGAFR